MHKDYKTQLYQHRTIETPRLLLRPLDVESDAPALFDLFADEQSAYFNFINPTTTLAEATLLLLDVFVKPLGVWAIIEKTSNQCIGTIDLGLGSIKRNDAVSLGYGLIPRARKQGYATEAVNQVVAFAFNQLAITRIQSEVNSANMASCQLLERCGFVLEGTKRKSQRATDGVLVDMAMYALLIDDLI